MIEPLYQCDIIDHEPIPASRPRVPRYGKAYYGKRYTAWRALLQAELPRLKRPLGGPVEIRLAFYGSRKNADLDNLAKGVLDALVEVGVIVDDNRSVVPCLKLLAYDPPGIGRGFSCRIYEST